MRLSDASADRWAAGVFLRRAPAVAALLQVAGPRGWLAFAGLYAYFRVWDDRIDVPDRLPTRERARLDAEAAARRVGTPGRERDALANALARRPLQPVVQRMWSVLERDADRPRHALPRSWLLDQRQRIGGAYADALWICLGERGATPTALRQLAIEATAVHAVRDLQHDLGLGYVNVPAEVCAERGLDAVWPEGPALAAWRAAEAKRAREHLVGVPRGASWRVRWVFGALSSRYRAVADELVADCSRQASLNAR